MHILTFVEFLLKERLINQRTKTRLDVTVDHKCPKTFFFWYKGTQMLLPDSSRVVCVNFTVSGIATATLLDYSVIYTVL
jgi:hypothetical protein